LKFKIVNIKPNYIIGTANMPIDWKQAPKTARWWAIDEDGNAHWFLAPNVAAFTKFWFSDPVPAPNFGYVGDWKKSLTERP
jgi:hypothetical protein